jgi:streptogramin lyase
LSSNGQVQAQIAVGQQPQWLHAAFGSLWVSNHHGASLSRVDPATNSVAATADAGAPGVFRSGPQGMTDDGTNVYVVSSNQQSLQAVDPATNVTTTFGPIDDVGCGPLAAIDGVIWSVDACSGAFYQLSTDGVEKEFVPSAAGAPGGITTRGDELWISDDTTSDPNTFQGSNAVLEQLDSISGDVLRTVPIGGDAVDVVSGFGDLWVYDSVANTIRRVHV